MLGQLWPLCMVPSMTSTASHACNLDTFVWSSCICCGPTLGSFRFFHLSFCLQKTQTIFNQLLHQPRLLAFRGLSSTQSRYGSLVLSYLPAGVHSHGACFISEALSFLAVSTRNILNFLLRLSPNQNRIESNTRQHHARAAYASHCGNFILHQVSVFWR